MTTANPTLIQPRRERDPITGALLEIQEHPIAECYGREDRVRFIQNGNAFGPSGIYLGRMGDNDELIPCDQEKTAEPVPAEPVAEIDGDAVADSGETAAEPAEIHAEPKKRGRKPKASAE